MMLLRLTCSAAVATPILLALALLGLFETPFILIAFGAFTVLAWLISPKRECRVCAGWWDLAVFGTVAIALALYAHPAEYVLKDRDPGVYTVVAAKLARTGELISYDPLVAAVSSFHSFEYGTKHPGFYILGGDLVVPQFFPGPFVWMGLGDLVGGEWGILYVVPVFGALSVGVAFMLGAELFGRWAGLLGAALLAVGYTQVWWSRYPSSEVITQFFILAGLWTAARFVRGGGAGTGVLAGALLGCATLVRIDAVLATLVIPALVGYDLLLGRPLRRWVPVCAPLLLLGGTAMLYTVTVGERYLELIRDLHVPDSVPISPYLLLGLLLLAAVVVWAVRRWWSERLVRVLEVYGRGIALLVALEVLGVALWAYFVWPAPWEGLPEYWGGAAGRMAEFHAYDRQAAARMVWFLTPAVAVLAMAGLVLAAYRLNSARALFLGAVLAFGCLYVALPNVAPDLPWATRRFVPVVFPGLCLLAGYAAVETGRALGRLWGARVGAACAAALAVSSLAWTVWVAWPVYDVRELAGAVEGLERLEAEIPAAEVLYFELPGDDYAATLDYLYGRPTLAYDREQFREELSELREAGLLEDAVYVTVEEADEPDFPGLRLRQVGREEVSFLRLEDGFKSVPYDTYEERQGFRIYEIEQTS